MISLEQLHEKAERHRAAIVALERKIISGDCRDRIVAALKKQRASLAQMEKKMRRDDPPAVPAAGWELVVKRQITSNGKVYPVGCRIPPETLGKNLQAFLSAHYVAFAPPGAAKATATARDLPPPAPLKRRPSSIEIVADSDAVLSWHKTLALTAERCDGDFGMARDILMAHRDASALFLRATKIWCDGEAKRRNVVSVSPAGL